MAALTLLSRQSGGSPRLSQPLAPRGRTFASDDDSHAPASNVALSNSPSILAVREDTGASSGRGAPDG